MCIKQCCSFLCGHRKNTAAFLIKQIDKRHFVTLRKLNVPIFSSFPSSNAKWMRIQFFEHWQNVWNILIASVCSFPSIFDMKNWCPFYKTRNTNISRHINPRFLLYNKRYVVLFLFNHIVSVNRLSFFKETLDRFFR